MTESNPGPVRPVPAEASGKDAKGNDAKGNDAKGNDDWRPPAGMTKLTCIVCRRDFASRGDVTCAVCLAKRGRRRRAASESPFDRV